MQKTRSLRFFFLSKNYRERTALDPWDAVEHDHKRQRIQRVSLECDGYPLIVWWHPANPHQPELKKHERFKPFTVKMMLINLNNGEIKQPVIVDLATQTAGYQTRLALGGFRQYPCRQQYSGP